FLVCVLLTGSASAADLPGNASASGLVSIAEFQSAAAGRGRTISSFRIEGVVCALARERRLAVLQDDSGAVLLELPAIASDLDARRRNQRRPPATRPALRRLPRRELACAARFQFPETRGRRHRGEHRLRLSSARRQHGVAVHRLPRGSEKRRLYFLPDLRRRQ